MNEKLNRKLDEQNRQMIEYEREILEKTQKINYFNLLMRKKKTDKTQ